MVRRSITCAAALLLLIGCYTQERRLTRQPEPLSGPFAEYDRAVYKKVQDQWYHLIDKYGIYERSGAVRVRFCLSRDGSVQDVQVASNSAGQVLGLFCVKAIEDAAPFEPLPDDLQGLAGNEAREAEVTFYY